MKIFITGSDGQLSKSILPLIKDHEVFLGNRSTVDITNRDQVITAITTFKPDFIFHFASLTRGDECANNPDKAYDINVNGTRYVVEACQQTHSTLVFVSTNEVFDGKTTQPYTESDTPNPQSVVGKNKFEAEEIIREQIKKHYIIRTMWLYSEWSGNFLQTIFELAQHKNELNIVDDEIGSPTNSHDLAEAIIKLIETQEYGTYNLTNKGIVSRYDLAYKAFQIKNFDTTKLKKIKLDDYPRLSKPPLYSALDTTKAENLRIYLRPWDEALQDFLLKVDLQG